MPKILFKTRAVLGFRGRYLGRSLNNINFHFYCQYFVLVCLLYCSNKMMGVVRFGWFVHGYVSAQNLMEGPVFY